MGVPCTRFAGMQCKLYWLYFFSARRETIISTQDRLTFKPTAEEIVEFTVPHLETAPFPIISFGQGCEGEPLLMWETIRESIIEIRKHTAKRKYQYQHQRQYAQSRESLV